MSITFECLDKDATNANSFHGFGLLVYTHGIFYTLKFPEMHVRLVFISV